MLWHLSGLTLLEVACASPPRFDNDTAHDLRLSNPQPFIHPLPHTLPTSIICYSLLSFSVLLSRDLTLPQHLYLGESGPSSLSTDRCLFRERHVLVHQAGVRTPRPALRCPALIPPSRSSRRNRLCCQPGSSSQSSSPALSRGLTVLIRHGRHVPEGAAGR